MSSKGQLITEKRNDAKMGNPKTNLNKTMLYKKINKPFSYFGFLIQFGIEGMAKVFGIILKFGNIDKTRS